MLVVMVMFVIMVVLLIFGPAGPHQQGGNEQGGFQGCVHLDIDFCQKYNSGVNLPVTD
jgi:hypothetical protein